MNSISKSNSTNEKVYAIAFDTITIIGILFLSNSIVMCCNDFNYQGLTEIRFFILAGVILILFGNCMSFGELFIDYFLFDSVIKE